MSLAFPRRSPAVNQDSPVIDESTVPTTTTWVVSVRDLIEFVLRRGGLTRGSFRSARRAHEGTRGHQDVQRQRPAAYQPEVPIRDEIRTPSGQVIVVQGRVDGIMQTAAGWLVEEIKTVVGEWDGEARESHWSQAKVYAALWARERRLAEIDIQLTYLHLDTNDLTVFRKTFTHTDLLAFYENLTEIYRAWIELQAAHRQVRDLSIREATFPFPNTREGQETLLAKSGEVLQNSHTLLAEAPTGIGKTISVLYAAVKELPRSQGKLRLAYLTAKTTGHESARKAVADLAQSGVRLNALAFAARDRLCLGQKDGSPCDVLTCPLAQQHYDHRQAAMQDALAQGWVGIDELRVLAEKHQVCPSALALDLVPWVDLIVCDYNYVFDPSVRLASLTNEGQRQVALLIDEAHNLPDRARRMYSADLSSNRLSKLKQALGNAQPLCKQALDKILQILRDTSQREGVNRKAILLEKLPSGLRAAIGNFLPAADHVLTRGEAAAYHESLLDVYFELSTFLKLLELGNEHTHSLLLEQFGAPQRRQLVLRWLCLDPGPLLEKVYTETGPAIIFSATLSPAPYFDRLLGHTSHPSRLQLSSPFPPENLGLLVHPGIATTYRRRGESYGQVAEILATFASGKPGNYFAFFSSYEYLRQVEEQLRTQHPKNLRILSQSSDMDLDERAAFLKQFQKPTSTRARKSLLGLAVLGGVFGEGIDLVGESLIGVAVVGVGLPQVNTENDLIKQRFSDLGERQDDERGFDFAYTYPGFNRVLQAVGRLIRTEEDRGMALLIDERYRQHRYKQLFPEWWEPTTVRSTHDMVDAQEAFWKS